VTTSVAERIRAELADVELSAELRASIDDWLDADKAFNVWFLVTTKRALRDDELMELLDGYRESQEIVEEAWADFQEKKNGTMLIEGITQSIHRMKLLQDRGS
jgi:hypothetical protein